MIASHLNATFRLFMKDGPPNEQFTNIQLNLWFFISKIQPEDLLLAPAVMEPEWQMALSDGSVAVLVERES